MLTRPGNDLIGRGIELSRIRRYILAPGGCPAMLVTGSPGSGKTRLLSAAVDAVHRDGQRRVLTVHGSTGSVTTAREVIRRLLLAVRDVLPGLPPPARRPALRCLGLIGGPSFIEPGELRDALVTALAAACATTPVLIVADDVQRFTPDAAALLAGLTSAAPGVLMAGRTSRIPDTLADVERLDLGPLGTAEAARLLDAQPRPATGRTRAEVLRRAAGNPAALLELTAAGRLQDAYTADLAILPEPTRRLLLHLAAAAVPTDPRTVMSAADVYAGIFWQPAEHVGFILHTSSGVAFAHPLAAEAAYRTVPAHLRREAHQNLAASPSTSPERRALHIAAAAAAGHDETVAAGLEDAAAVFRGRRDFFEAAAAMEQAAERSPDPESAARRLALAVADARDLGVTQWATDLHAAVRRTTADPELITAAALAAARALSRSGRQHAAYGLLAAARRSGPAADPATALGIAGLAAALTGASGSDDHRRGLAPMLADAAAPLDDPTATFVRLMIDPASHHGRALCDAADSPTSGRPLTAAARHRLNVIGTIAWYEDRSRLAIDLLRAAFGDDHPPRGFPPGTESVPVLITCLMDTGDWEMAERYADAVDLTGLPMVDANVNALRAQLHALRGNSDEALRLAHRTWQGLDADENRSTHVRLLRAAGLAAAAAGDYENGYRHLRAMFDPDGRPLHPFLAARSVAELAAVAARTGRRAEARTVVERVRDEAGNEASTRMRLLLHLSDALLDASDSAECHFRLAVTDPAGSEWPYERACSLLSYGEWLRRMRRPRDSRAPLSAAAAAFTKVGAAWAAAAATRELRAGGSPDDAETARLSVLTTQERQVAQLAVQGLRNRQIAEQLFISVRTVGAHLSSAYHKLGIGRRYQLREAFRPR